MINMPRSMQLLLFFSQSFFVAQAAPAAISPISLSMNDVATSNLSTVPSLPLDEETVTSLDLFLNTSNPADVVTYRVPDTNTVLRISVQDTPIGKANLGRTILRTQQSLASFIRVHDADDEPLARADDPYESSTRYPGCFFGVATLPIGYHHLTYGIVMNVLNGLWWYMYMGGRYFLAVFEVMDDQFGIVGIGEISPDRLRVGAEDWGWDFKM